jgi:hypothetical protein
MKVDVTLKLKFLLFEVLESVAAKQYPLNEGGHSRWIPLTIPFAYDTSAPLFTWCGRKVTYV